MAINLDERKRIIWKDLEVGDKLMVKMPTYGSIPDYKVVTVDKVHKLAIITSDDKRWSREHGGNRSSDRDTFHYCYLMPLDQKKLDDATKRLQHANLARELGMVRYDQLPIEYLSRIKTLVREGQEKEDTDETVRTE